MAINVRANHVHAIISIGAKSSEQALIALKANATRGMKNDGLWNGNETPWAEKDRDESSGTKEAYSKHVITS